MSSFDSVRFPGLASGCLAAMLAVGLAHGEEVSPLKYPATRRDQTSEMHFGTRVADPYRWLENDLHLDAEVAAWVDEQDALARTYLATLAGRSAFRERLSALVDRERTSGLEMRAGRSFFLHNSGLERHSKLLVSDAEGMPGRTLLDPNAWSPDGSVALAEWSPSRDGSHVAFATQQGGADWRTIRVVDVESGDVLEDEVAWARFTRIAWSGDGEGFFYSRFPQPPEGADANATIAGHAVYFHRLGTPQKDDRLVYSTPDHPGLMHIADVTDDGAYLHIFSSPGSGGSAPTVVDLSTDEWVPRTLVSNFDDYWTVAGNIGARIVLTTTAEADRGRVVTLDLDDPDASFIDLVPEAEGSLNEVEVMGDRLIVTYLADAQTEAKRFRLDGSPDEDVPLPGIGNASGFRGIGSGEAGLFEFTSFNAPSTTYRYDAARNTIVAWNETGVSIDLDQIVVEQRFYASRDGTRVPMFVIRRKDVLEPAPTVLYGYGGYSIPMLPHYNIAALAWVLEGGVYAVANIRGGGEYGKAWHDGGRLLQKQNSFDDFIAAAEYLKSEGITSSDGLAAQGESNGAFIVSAAVNQRPDLFAAALPGVGHYDMLRFDRFTGGQVFVSEFGSPSKEADFRNLLTYSPLHNVEAGKEYPAMLVTTADTDTRVVPGHSFKYVATLQAADLGARPRILRVERGAGHGAGRPADRILDEVADLWAFAARWTGLRVRASD